MPTLMHPAFHDVVYIINHSLFLYKQNKPLQKWNKTAHTSKYSNAFIIRTQNQKPKNKNGSSSISSIISGISSSISSIIS